jgi:ankyrin repeat protein
VIVEDDADANLLLLLVLPAIINGHEGVIRRMLQAGAATNVRDSQGRTPLDIAAAMQLPPSTLHVLLQHIDKQYRTRQQNGDGTLSM